MRVKSVGKRRSVPSATGPSFSAIPLLSAQHIAAVYDTENDDDDCIKSGPKPKPQPEPVDLLDRTICICCDERGKEEEVLVCFEKDCPVTVHANCIGSEPKFDASGNFYCPYCWFKRAMATCQQLKEKAMVAKKALSTFLGTRADSDATPCREHVNPVQDGPIVSEAESEDEGEVSVTMTGSSVSETGDSESEGISVKKRKVGSVRKSLLPSNRGKMARNVNAEVQNSTSLRKPRRSPLQVMKQKRRRLLWTDEEEKVLKGKTSGKMIGHAREWNDLYYIEDPNLPTKSHYLISETTMTSKEKVQLYHCRTRVWGGRLASGVSPMTSISSTSLLWLGWRQHLHFWFILD